MPFISKWISDKGDRVARVDVHLVVLRLEQRALDTQSTDVSCGAIMVASSALLGPSTEGEAAWQRDGTRVVARLRACTAVAACDGSLSRGVYAITGGLGGLGLRAAAMLVSGDASRVLLASRSGRVMRDGQGLDARRHLGPLHHRQGLQGHDVVPR